jgi:hypothetical protein
MIWRTRQAVEREERNGKQPISDEQGNLKKQFGLIFYLRASAFIRGSFILLEEY